MKGNFISRAKHRAHMWPSPLGVMRSRLLPKYSVKLRATGDGLVYIYAPSFRFIIIADWMSPDSSPDSLFKGACSYVSVLRVTNNRE